MRREDRTAELHSRRVLSYVEKVCTLLKSTAVSAGRDADVPPKCLVNHLVGIPSDGRATKGRLICYGTISFVCPITFEKEARRWPCLERMSLLFLKEKKAGYPECASNTGSGTHRACAGQLVVAKGNRGNITICPGRNCHTLCIFFSTLMLYGTKFLRAV